MPVFHTKTIESILEPVAQQVSKLVILHEEAEDGNAMPDLAKPVQAVKVAVDNLVRVGHETCNNSEDQILKQDMPPALHRVEDASYLLLDASQMLRADPYSAPARKKLIEGSRGILQGTSALLLAFDESEVRKIIRICKNVLEYLAITEVVETMDDLVTYVKNLSPVLTKMTKEVDSREKELTHQFHRELLVRSLDRVKQLTPVLISGVKIYIGTKDQAMGRRRGYYIQETQLEGGRGLPDAQNNRDYVVHEMSSEIHEIIRVLQLTTYDEDEWDADDITVMRRALNALEGKMKQAGDWLQDPNGLVGGSGERALRQILDDATKIAERCADPRDREEILKAVGDISNMADTLAELRQNGQGDSPQAISLARGIQQRLNELQDKVLGAVNHTERSGIRRPAHTLSGKVDQAQRWLNNPAVNDMGLGEQAIGMVVDEGRRVAETLPGPARGDMLRLCDDVERLSNQLGDMCRNGMANSPQAKALAAQLSNKLRQLKGRIQEALVNNVADDFIDIGGPLKQMSDAAMAPYGTPNREANFEQKAGRFQDHSNMLVNTAQMVAADGGNSNRKTVEGIFSSVNQVSDLAPQVVKAARIVLNNPGNQAATEHFDMLKRQWLDQMETLRSLVDEAIDTSAFIKATEYEILKDTDKTEDAIRNVDAPGIVYNTSNIARRANRVLQVAQQEADNSEDPHFVDRVNNSIKELRSTITPMVQNAKGIAQNPRDQGYQQGWRGTNQQLIDAVGQVRQAVTPAGRPPGFSPSPMDDYPYPDMNQLHISDQKKAAHRDEHHLYSEVGHQQLPEEQQYQQYQRKLLQQLRDEEERVIKGRSKSHTPPQPISVQSVQPRGDFVFKASPQKPYATSEKFERYQTTRTDTSKGVHLERSHQERHHQQELDQTRSLTSEHSEGSFGMIYPTVEDSMPKVITIRPELVPDARAPYGRDGMFSDTDQSYFSEPELALNAKNAKARQNQKPDLGGYEYPHYQGKGAKSPVPGGVPLPGMAPFEIDIDELMKRAELEKQRPRSRPTEARVPPEVPPPPSGYHLQDNAPPRPPLPGGGAPPRPPPPESEDEDEQFPVPQENQPIMMAAHALHMDVQQWSSRDNEIIAAAKRMAMLMAKLSQLVRGEGGKRELIDTAKAIAQASEEVTKLAKELAAECTDKRMRTGLLQVCERIPTIGTQLKILSTVKATMLGAQEMEPVPNPDGSEIMCGSEEDEEATEMLIGNAQNLMQSVRETVKAAQAASIKMRVDSGYTIRWVRKKPWYT